ncbi:MORC family CW-type zinc finger protein 3 [Stegastes partitus]|uniref:MORC family CW-type zinc finger protein 3 n=1 Tax=Stegastes partitus TaxID=144197 RepID=A0A9Y4JTD5_9TELE|nr:PREDICTED: MORC family CW-type zinc finger protein 4 [Stegastes partitus]
MARLSEHGIRLSSMSPSFLNSNSTSHTWPFSAVAELIDNASDPGVFAKQIWIDAVHEADHLCVTFTDNGSGMTPNKLHKMLSFGFTEKGSGKASHQAIGVYGNGFKSGSMRLGRDALIFTKNGGCQTVGMLSQTYLENIKAQAVIVPIVPFNQQTKSLVVTEDSEASLAAILQHSILSSLDQIHVHFDSILSKKGTKILIWNIRRAKDGKTEIDFETDPSDFRLPEIQIEELQKGQRNSGSLRTEHNIPDMHYSLRAYLSILYLKPRTQIILRGRKVLTKLVSKRLTHIEHDVYKPHFSKEKVKVTFGLNPKNKDHYGIMMYHKNRLIKAYEKVGCQLKASGQRAGIGVIGIIECNFLKPAHNKQDFEYTKEYRLTLGALGLKLNDYWKEVTEKKAREREFQAVDKDKNSTDEGPLWLQCEECLKWRSIPASYCTVTPEDWNCSMNPNARYRSCSAPEEAEESEELLTPSYQKNHKKLEHHRSRKREKSLEVCDFQEPVAKHHNLSRSSSEPVQPTFQSTHTPERTTARIQHDTEDETLRHVETDTDHLADHHADTSDAQTQSVTNTEEKPVGSNMAIKDRNETTPGQTLVEKETDDQELGDEECDTEKNTEGQEEHTDTLSHKRPSESLFYFVKKKRYFWEDQLPDSGNIPDELHPGKHTNAFKIASVETNRKDSGGRAENSDTLQQTPSCHTWTHSPTSTQTVMVSPLSRTEGSHSRTLPPEAGDREAKLQRLAGLEKEVQRLRSLLGLEITKTTQATMTSSYCSAEKQKQDLVKPSVCTASTEIGCQTDMAECSASSSSGLVQAVGPQGLLVQAQKAVLEPKDQSEQNRPKKNESQSRMKVSDGEACEDSRSSQENLRDIRNNVVVLLTALLPQLDLAGISMDTTDVDSILQQIIEVNSLKL